MFYIKSKILEFIRTDTKLTLHFNMIKNLNNYLLPTTSFLSNIKTICAFCFNTYVQ